MTTTLISTAAPMRGPLPARVGGLDFVAVREDLWRVVRRDGSVPGHIERLNGHDGIRFAARRSLGGARVLALGEFWSAQGAADCFQ